MKYTAQPLNHPLFLMKTRPLRALLALVAVGTSLLPACSPAGDEKSDPSAELADIIESLQYQGRLNTTSQGSENPLPTANTALAIARTQDPSIPPVELKKTLQAFLARSTNDSFQVVTIEDLTGSASESLDGQASQGGMQQFTSNQQALQFALSQGIPAILAINVDNLNLREAKSTPGVILADARGTVSLLSGPDAARVNSSTASTRQRGFDAAQVLDKTLDDLATNLAAEITDWQLPEPTAANQAYCEIHAHIEGLTMPAFDSVDGQLVFQNQTIPLFAEGATVELDGVMVGQTPCRVTTGRGMRKLKVHRDGMKPFEAVVNLSGQNRFDVILSPTPETLQQFNEQLAYLRALDQQQAISEAEVNVINGYAKMLRQSGFRIDQRDIKDSRKLSLDKEDRPQ
jgi:hypothetical protein